MPVALPLTMRQLIVTEKQKGATLAAISQHYHLSYTTVCRIYQRFKESGLPGLVPRYSLCGHHTPYKVLLKRAALWLKRRHPGWGAAFIKIHLEQRYRYPVPGERTLQRWFRHAGLYAPKTRWVTGPVLAAAGVHDTWQIDAKEKLRLPGGLRLCYLTVVDQKSGSLLKAFVFPPLSNQRSATEWFAALFGAQFSPVGSAPESASGQRQALW